jgi:glycosyltransferase involved in cell wall biosynthesis
MPSNEPPLVSILINAYNAERHIAGAIDSALAQTYQNIEIVVLDDGSTDRTAEIVQGYHDPRIRKVLENHIGLVAGRNRLLREAKGEFLTWLDVDDRYMPRKVEREAEFLVRHEEISAVYCDTVYFFTDEPDVRYRHAQVHHQGKIFEQLLDRIFINNTAFMMRRSVVEQLGYFNTATGISEDWEYFLRMAQYGMSFGYLDEPLVLCELRDDSHSRFSQKPTMKESVVAIFENLRGQMSEAEQERYHMRERIQSKYRELALAFLGAGRKQDFYRAWQKGGEGLAWSFACGVLRIAVAIVPGRWISGMIRAAADMKKKRNYIPIRDGGILGKNI